MKKYQRVAAWIDLDAIEENFEAMRAGLPAGTKMAAVVKANGYGHGAVPIAQLMEPKDYIWGFAAATIEEALALRSYGSESLCWCWAMYFRTHTKSLWRRRSVRRFSVWTWRGSFPGRRSGRRRRCRSILNWIRG